MFAILLLGGILSGVHGPVIAPVTLDLATEFNKGLTAIAQLSSYMLLVIAGVAYFDAAFAHVYGKRGIFVVSMAIMMAADAWAAKTEGYESLLGARIFSGAGQAAFECLSSSVIADLYFVHQRPKRVGLFVLLFGTGVYTSGCQSVLKSSKCPPGVWRLLVLLSAKVSCSSLCSSFSNPSINANTSILWPICPRTPFWRKSMAPPKSKKFTAKTE